MGIFTRTLLIIAISGVAIGLSACGGGDGGGTPTSSRPDYDGATTPAAIDANNAEAIGATSTEATAEAIEKNNANAGNPFAVTISDASSSMVPETVSEIVKQIVTKTESLNIPAALTLSYTDLNSQTGTTNYCGGSVTAPDNPGTSFTMTFNNLCYDAPGDNLNPMTMNGQIQYTETDTGTTLKFIDFKVTMDGKTETLNMTMTCDNFGGCSISSDYVGMDGKTYKIEDFSVTGNDSSGYYVSATFYHPDYGYVDLATTSPLVFNCSPDWQPGSGTLSITGTGGTSGSITFDSCSSYTYCYSDGVTEQCDTGMW